MATNYVTIAEAARRLDVSRSTVWRWIRQGRLRAYRAGQRTIRIRDEDLDAQMTPFQPLDTERPKPEKEDIWGDYDPEKALEALRRARGILKGVDIPQLKKDLKEARSQADRRPSR